MGTLLDQINSSQDLKKLSLSDLAPLCAELRDFITHCCATNPGHLGASLGTIELTVALHYVFDLPNDKIIWDVGHQAYAHKILTGRRDAFKQNRCYQGISGFPRRDESPCDAFGTGHSSTSISAALGFAVAASLQHTTDHVVAVIGDGSLTGGLAYEGLNNAGGLGANILIIFNDNQMSIEPNVGGLHNSLLKITTSVRYNKLKEHTWTLLGASAFRNFMQKMVKAIKRSIVGQSTIFQSLGIRYFGPVDGHNVIKLVHTLQRLKMLEGPRLLHTLTIKGKGYAPAEHDQTTWHAPGPFDPDTGMRLNGHAPDGPQKLRFQDVFGQTLLELARTNPLIVGITPAMPTGCSLNLMMKEMPERCFDVGIAEQHAVTFAAGLAAAGYLPFCNIYSSFMQRAYDSVIHDVALQNLKVVLCLDRAGLVGEDGPTHHGAFDLAYFQCVPNLFLAAPMDEYEFRNMLFSAQDNAYPALSIRYPRGSGLGLATCQDPFTFIPPGKARLISQGADIALLTIGTVGLAGREAVAQLAQQGIGVQHYDMRFLKPLDTDVLAYVCAHYNHIVTVEDGSIVGGLHHAVAAYVCEHANHVRVTALGIPDHFVTQGKTTQLQHECGYDTAGIVRTIMRETSKSEKR